MRVSRAQAEENRQHVIDVASRLFRQHGFDGIGLKDLMEAAGLTQGAFYKQFSSKEDLIAEASARALEYSNDRWQRCAMGNPDDPLEALIGLYLSKGHRKETMDGCPLVALGSDAARQGADVKASFEAGVREHLGVMARYISDVDTDERRDKAIAVLSMMVGAVTLSRAVNDARLAQSILNAAAYNVRKIASS